jgi:hypothetical protein
MRRFATRLGALILAIGLVGACVVPGASPAPSAPRGDASQPAELDPYEAGPDY